eukprot:GCRY01006342.1.p1 GENE.GCRY01006342.1~~GCRY01006342.1.p1  ORF type:complete len:387 (+),score=41.51 GCRY01006342.1:113-1273(+)
MFTYLTPQELKGLYSYKYSGSDGSLLSKYVFQHYWNAVVRLMPLWLAPNLITLIGFLAVVISHLVLYCYVPTLSGAAPSWVYCFCAFCLFFYQTFDAIDGKQARRTGTSSPLGELFDHGCDALNTGITTISVLASLQMGSNLGSLLVFCSAYIQFWVATWEEYHTGCLRLGVVNGPTEGILMTVALYLVTGAFGPGVWSARLETLSAWLSTPVDMRTVIVGFMCFAAVFAVIDSFICVLMHSKKKLSVVSLLAEHACFALTVAAAIVPVWVSPPFFERHARLVLFVYILLFAMLVGRMITSRLCAAAFSWAQPLLMFPLTLAANALFARFLPSGEPIVGELVLLTSSFCVIVVIYIQFIHSVISSFCTALNINCLTIPQLEKEKSN